MKGTKFKYMEIFNYVDIELADRFIKAFKSHGITDLQRISDNASKEVEEKRMSYGCYFAIQMRLDDEHILGW